MNSAVQLSLRDMSDDDYDQFVARYGPLADDIRELVDAGLRTEASDADISAARGAIQFATATLRSRLRDESQLVHYRVAGRPLAWNNAVVGLRNAVAPPVVVRHDGVNHRCWSDFTLGVAYEGPPGLVHGGVCALILDHILGEAASEGLTKMLFTGTITVKYVRGTPLGQLHAEATIERSSGRKTYVNGHLADAGGITVEAQGIFIQPA